MTMLRLAPLAVALALVATVDARFVPPATTVAADVPVASPASAVAELLAADRAFSASSARTDLITGLTAMMAPDVIMPVPGRGFADGTAAVAAEWRRDTLNATSRAEWTPVRGGISADGQHGFTFGFITVRRADGSEVPGKYLAYWVKGASGWRVAAYKRGRRAAGAIDTTMLAPALPAALVAPSRDPKVLAAQRESVSKVEREFSRDAQLIGLGPAFARYGSADAMNMGGAGLSGFVLGNMAIAAHVSQGVPEDTSPFTWGPDRALAASSGDLGVTFGLILSNAARADGTAVPGFPFFTVWRKAGPGAPWRYVAE